MKTAYKIVINILIFAFVAYSFNGIIVERGLFSILFGGAIFAGLMYAIDPILGFFKFPKNFWAYLIIGSIFNLLYFIVLNSFLLGVLNFRIGSIGGEFGPFTFPILNLENEIVTVIFAALLTALMSLLINQLRKK